MGNAHPASLNSSPSTSDRYSGPLSAYESYPSGGSYYEGQTPSWHEIDKMANQSTPSNASHMRRLSTSDAGVFLSRLDNLRAASGGGSGGSAADDSERNGDSYDRELETFKQHIQAAQKGGGQAASTTNRSLNTSGIVRPRNGSSIHPLMIPPHLAPSILRQKSDVISNYSGELLPGQAMKGGGNSTMVLSPHSVLGQNPLTEATTVPPEFLRQLPRNSAHHHAQLPPLSPQSSGDTFITEQSSANGGSGLTSPAAFTPSGSNFRSQKQGQHNALFVGSSYGEDYHHHSHNPRHNISGDGGAGPFFHSGQNEWPAVTRAERLTRFKSASLSEYLPISSSATGGNSSVAIAGSSGGGSGGSGRGSSGGRGSSSSGSGSGGRGSSSSGSGSGNGRGRGGGSNGGSSHGIARSSSMFRNLMKQRARQESAAHLEQSSASSCPEPYCPLNDGGVRDAAFPAAASESAFGMNSPAASLNNANHLMYRTQSISQCPPMASPPSIDVHEGYGGRAIGPAGQHRRMHTAVGMGNGEFSDRVGSWNGGGGLSSRRSGSGGGNDGSSSGRGGGRGVEEGFDRSIVSSSADFERELMAHRLREWEAQGLGRSSRMEMGGTEEEEEEAIPIAEPPRFDNRVLELRGQEGGIADVPAAKAAQANSPHHRRGMSMGFFWPTRSNKSQAKQPKASNCDGSPDLLPAFGHSASTSCAETFDDSDVEMAFPVDLAGKRYDFVASVVPAVSAAASATSVLPALDQFPRYRTQQREEDQPAAMHARSRSSVNYLSANHVRSVSSVSAITVDADILPLGSGNSFVDEQDKSSEMGLGQRSLADRLSNKLKRLQMHVANVRGSHKALAAGQESHFKDFGPNVAESTSIDPAEAFCHDQLLLPLRSPVAAGSCSQGAGAANLDGGSGEGLGSREQPLLPAAQVVAKWTVEEWHKMKHWIEQCCLLQQAAGISPDPQSSDLLRSLSTAINLHPSAALAYPKSASSEQIEQLIADKSCNFYGPPCHEEEQAIPEEDPLLEQEADDEDEKEERLQQLYMRLNLEPGGEAAALSEALDEYEGPEITRFLSWGDLPSPSTLGTRRSHNSRPPSSAMFRKLSAQRKRGLSSRGHESSEHKGPRHLDLRGMAERQNEGSEAEAIVLSPASAAIRKFVDTKAKTLATSAVDGRLSSAEASRLRMQARMALGTRGSFEEKSGGRGVGPHHAEVAASHSSGVIVDIVRHLCEDMVSSRGGSAPTHLLDALLHETRSKFGFVATILHEPCGSSIKMHASNFDWRHQSESLECEASSEKSNLQVDTEALQEAGSAALGQEDSIADASCTAFSAEAGDQPWQQGDSRRNSLEDIDYLFMKVVTTGKPFIFDARTQPLEPDMKQPEGGDGTIFSILVVPLYSRMDLIGLCAMANNSAGYHHLPLANLQPLFNAVALALHGSNHCSRLREMNNLAQAWLKVTREGVICVDHHGVAKLVNAAAKNIFGLEDKEEDASDDDDEDGDSFHGVGDFNLQELFYSIDGDEDFTVEGLLQNCEKRALKTIVKRKDGTKSTFEMLLIAADLDNVCLVAILRRKVRTIGGKQKSPS